MAHCFSITTFVSEPFFIRYATWRGRSFTDLGNDSKKYLGISNWDASTLSSSLITLSGLLALPTFASGDLFLSLTIFHWGQGDRYLSVKLHRAGYLQRSGLLKFLHILSRGSLPILLPGYLGTETYRAFLEAMIRQGGGVESDLSWISQNAIFFLLVPLGLTLLQLLISLQKLEKGEQRAWRLDAFESFFLFVWFLTVPTLWALGTYFALWHSLRHGLRILWLDESGQKNLVGKTYLRLKLRWLQITGLMTVLALVGLWLLLALPLSFRGIELDWLGKAMLEFRYLPFRIQWWFALWIVFSSKIIEKLSGSNRAIFGINFYWSRF